MRYVCLFLGLGLAVGAQNEPGTLLLGSTPPAVIQEILPGTPPTPKVLYRSPSTTALIYGLTVDVDNRQLLFTVTYDPLQPLATGGVFRLDPATGGVTTVARDPGLFLSPRQIVVNPDGNYVVTTKSRTGPTTTEYRLLEIDRRTGQVRTLAREGTLGQAASWRGGLVVNADTGHYVLLDRDATAPAATRFPLLEVTAGGRITTLARLPIQPRFGLAQDPVTGRFFAGFSLDLFPTYPNGLLAVEPTGTVRTVVAGRQGGSRHAYDTLLRDRSTAAGRRLVSLYTGHVYFTDLRSFTVTSVAASPLSPFAAPRVLARRGGRHVQTVALQPRLWQIRLSYPTLPGRAYRIALGATGIRPGIPLPDGRRVNLNVDAFTLLSLQLALPGIFSPGRGLLDNQGRATGTLDLRRVPVLGVPLWLQVLVLDPTAPFGIAVVEDPYVLRI